MSDDDPRIARFELAAADHAAGECHAGLGGLEECAAVAAARDLIDDFTTERNP